ncbi:hypothetical protein [Dyella acidiphila]|uniref:Uncharacterized protein n=1 Tax=Dyella acidiphila TaxID=2775866 RepID=A0ABR9G4K4_9GAMM|nr:hypothetical protein [Dyella acidiphila]MBE1158985.1 hypothetical protein [Dyella acidiphila]
MNRKVLPLIACVLLLLPVLANASDICWIDKITKAAGGVEVHFIPRVDLSVFGPNASNLYVKDGVVRQATNNAEAHLVLAPGQGVSVGAMPEDMCLITATEQGGQLGVTAHAANNVGGQHTQVTEFYSAE